MDTRRAGRPTVGRALGSTVSTAIGAAVVDTRRAGRPTVSGALGSAVGTAIGTAVVDARGAEGSAVGGTFRLVRILLCISHVGLPDSGDRAVTGTWSPGHAVREQHRPSRGYPCSAGEGTALAASALE
ncbi:hypothetical protein [Kocuria nitroreducens]|uniref:hypothetical protein n=1 Tax=Kocuria nitroreducens TaxID=3058914 RepID=UPI0036D87833